MVFLLRTLNAADIALLRQIGELVGGSSGALGVIGVASRADEIGAGRLDAMLSAGEVARRFTDELNRAMLSVNRFVRPDIDLSVDVPTRAALLNRFGMFGIRISIAVLQAGAAGPLALADELLERSGLVALREVIDQQFAQRSASLKAHTALLTLRRFAEVHPIPATPHLIADIDPLLADTHAFEELRLLSQLRSRTITFTEDEMASLRRIIGGSGTDPASRLGLTPRASHDGPRAAFAAAQRWRRRAEHPLNDPFTTRACRAAVRSAEVLVALVAQYAAQGY